MFNSLKFQISSTLLLLFILFTAAISYTFLTLEHQSHHDTVVTLSGRLQLTVQYMSNQAMRYKQHAPRNYDSYTRDLELYYQDLLHHVETFDMISDAFMHQDFNPEITGLVDVLHPKLSVSVAQAISRLEDDWLTYRRELFDALGPLEDQPRLEWAAEYVLKQNGKLESSARNLSDSLQHWSIEELARIRRINHSVMLTSGVVSICVLIWLFIKVLPPLDRTLRGFHQVSQGDFGFQVPEQGSLETVQLTRAFNHLSSRLSVLFDLIGRLQQGSDLDQTLAFLSREFQTLLRIDWIGVLFVTGDSQSIKLEASYLNGKSESVNQALFRLHRTLLEQALAQTGPLRVDNIAQIAAENPSYVFLDTLVKRGMHDCILLPLTRESQSPLPGVLVFSCRAENSYDREHLNFLSNIAQLVTHSFGRTVKLAEHNRLVAIGEFASGIAHEIRNPLATIGMALDHLANQDLPPNSSKRARLATRETERLARLLDDMLLYAKPLSMDTHPVDLGELCRELAHLHRDEVITRGCGLEVAETVDGMWVLGDKDRLSQIWLNLTRNALDASPAGGVITWTIRNQPQQGVVLMQVHNTGDTIEPDRLARLTEAFYTTKPSGTGLGLAIVKRLVEAHGGDMLIDSDAASGTRVSVSLPRHESRPGGTGIKNG